MKDLGGAVIKDIRVHAMHKTKFVRNLLMKRHQLANFRRQTHHMA